MKGKVLLLALLVLWAVPASADVQCVGFGCPLPGSITSSSTLITTTLPLALPSGTACTSPSLQSSADADSGLNFTGTGASVVATLCRNNTAAIISNSTFYANIGGSLGVQIASPFGIATFNTGFFGWYSSTLGAGSFDTAVGRFSAGVMKATDGTTTGVRALIGGGASVAAATALPLPTGNVFHVTGTTTITSITSTNFQAGVCITLIFDAITTLTDGSNLVMAGNFVTTADDTWSGCFDGTNWYESARSVN